MMGMPEKVDKTFIRYHEVPVCEHGAGDELRGEYGCCKDSVVCVEELDGSTWLCQKHYNEDVTSMNSLFADPDSELIDYDTRDILRPPFPTDEEHD